MMFRLGPVVAALALALAASQPATLADTVAPAAGTRTILQAGLPGIDRGLRTDALLTTSLPDMPLVDRPEPFLGGRVIVKFRDGSAVDAGGSRPSYADFHLFSIGERDDPEEAARTWRERPDVEYAQPSYLAHFDFVPSDPLYAMQWNFPALDMEKAWDINPGGSRSVVVAVLDTGVAFENVIIRYNTRPFTLILPDGSRQQMNYGAIDVPFAAATDLVGPDRIVAPFDFTWDDRHPLDTLGHGTHVAGTIGQLTNNSAGGAGMAFNVRLMPVKVAAGGPWDFIFGAPHASFTDDQVARAIRYAADNGANVINMSFGRTGAPAPVVEDAVRYAVGKGAFCVFSAGNEGLFSPMERYAEIASRVDGAVAVGAVGPTLDRAPYSSVGSWVELTAPGGDTTGRGVRGAILQQSLDASLFASPLRAPRFDALVYVFAAGTSMAAPHVSGLAALLYQQGITNPAAIEAAMKQFATDRGAAGRDNHYGAGIINPRATLRGLGVAR